jgi:fatty acid kinase fatty acid binding subunit
MTVAIVTDSCCEMTPEQLREYDIVQVPLTVFFGETGALSPDEIPPDEFWRKLTAPDAPFPHTAAPSAGQFKLAYEKLFAAGADEIVYVGMSETLSTSINSGRMAAQMMPERTILTVDSRSACMGIGTLAIRASRMARSGSSAHEIVETLERAKAGIDVYVGLETLEYLRKGGRISSAKAVIGGLLSIKPIIRVIDGEVIVHEQARTRARATERVLELLTEKPLTALHVLYAPPVDADAWRDAILARLPGPPPRLVTTQIIGPVIGTHVGPGAYGAVLVREP